MSEYAPDKFYVESTDGRGHKDTIRLSLPPLLLNQAGIIVAQKVVPQYRTSADVIRDGLVHRLHWLENEFDAENNSLKSDLTLLRLLEEQAINQRRDENIGAVLYNFVQESYMAMRHPDRIPALLSSLNEALHTLPLTQTQRDQLLAIQAQLRSS